MKAYNLETALKSPRQIQELYIHMRGLNALPNDILLLENLERLVLSSNHLESVPAQIQHLPKLKHLDLSNNQITSIPNWLTKLKLLSTVNLSNNKIKATHNQFPQGVEILDLSRNKLSEKLIVLDACTKLQKLNLSQNHIGAIPESILLLTNLKDLDLSKNRIKNISSIKKLANRLIRLNIDHNPLNLNLLESIEWPQLDYLSMKTCNQKNLQIKNAPNLKYLDLSYNRIHILNWQSLLKSKLRNLKLQRNPLRQIDPIIFLQNSDLTIEQIPSRLLSGWTQKQIRTVAEQLVGNKVQQDQFLAWIIHRKNPPINLAFDWLKLNDRKLQNELFKYIQSKGQKIDPVKSICIYQDIKIDNRTRKLLDNSKIPWKEGIDKEASHLLLTKNSMYYTGLEKKIAFISTQELRAQIALTREVSEYLGDIPRVIALLKSNERQMIELGFLLLAKKRLPDKLVKELEILKRDIKDRSYQKKLSRLLNSNKKYYQ